MQPHENAAILQELAAGREVLLEALRGIPDELAAASPSPGRWSVVECVEHLAISEDFLLAGITGAQRSETPVVNPRREAAIMVRGLDRTTHVISPEVGRPTGRFSTLAEAVASFLATRKRTVRFVETCDEDLRARTMAHPLIGTINCHEALLVMAVHPRRHAVQIREIRTALGS
jgi:hypothetical protein